MDQTKKKCPYCGEEIMTDAKKCRFCGEWLDKNSASLPIEKPKGKKTWIHIAIAAILIIVATIVTINLCTHEKSGIDNTSQENTIASIEVVEIPIERQIADHLIKVMRVKGYDVQDNLTFTEISQMLYFDNQVQTAIRDGWTFCQRNQHEIDSLKSNIHGTGSVKIADSQEFLEAEKRWNAKIALLQKEIDEITQVIDSFVPEK